MAEAEALCYVGYCPECGLIQGAAVQIKGIEKETAKFIAPWIEAGERIGTLTAAEVRAAEWCKCSRKSKSPRAETPVRPEMKTIACLTRSPGFRQVMIPANQHMRISIERPKPQARAKKRKPYQNQRWIEQKAKLPENKS
jgi:hypothetical protein